MNEGKVFAELLKILKSMPGDTKEIAFGADGPKGGFVGMSTTLRSTGTSGSGTHFRVVTPWIFDAKMNTDEWILGDLRKRADELREEWKHPPAEAESADA